MGIHSVAFYISLFVAILGFFTSQKGTFRSFFNKPGFQIFDFPLKKFFASFVCAWIGGLFLQGALSSLITGSYENEMPNKMRADSFDIQLFALFFVDLLLPLFEEIVFRGYIFHATNSLLKSTRTATIIMALLFGACHPHFLATFLAAFFFMELRLKSRSLIFPMGAHILWNSTVLIMIFLTPATNIAEPIDTFTNVFLLVLSLGLLGGATDCSRKTCSSSGKTKLLLEFNRLPTV